MPAAVSSSPHACPVAKLQRALADYVQWLDRHGEFSQDHQDFYNGRIGRTAKRFYYDHPIAGPLAVLPMVIAEAAVPSSRRWFYPRMRHPIADAHFAMAFALLHEATGAPAHYERAVHFLQVLEQTRCPGYARHAWGYPFDWETRNGVIPAGTPLITTVPYCYEAVAAVYRLDHDPGRREMLRSIAEHGRLDYRDLPVRSDAATCTYTPHGETHVVNASAYRAFLLTSAAHEFADEAYRQPAQRNLNFVILSQQADGSWPYAMDGVRSFVDHFHTCFVLKALAKIEAITGDANCTSAIERGVAYYLDHLFTSDGLPRPFARRPRLTVYRHELYDFAECINLGILLRGRFARLDQFVDRTVGDTLDRWVRPGGCFSSRQLLVGWDNVPMFRWGHAAMLHSLARYSHEIALNAAPGNRSAEDVGVSAPAAMSARAASG